ncbi:MAG: phosphatase PAP2 family protein [Beijerinckiaceae bacterium]
MMGLFTPKQPALRRLAMIALVTGIGALAVSYAVASAQTAAIDRAILLWLRGAGEGAPPAGPGWLREAVRDVTALGSTTVLTLIIMCGGGFLLAAGRRRLAALLVGASVASTAVSSLLKVLFDRARPDIVPHDMATFTASFPSGHAMMSASILLTSGGLLAFAAHRRREQWVIALSALLLTLLVGLSRIYLGVHWPSDVLGGWLFGAMWASLTLMIARSMQH